MLNPFPDLLMLGFFAPTLVRVAAAGVFAYLAYYHLQHQRGDLWVRGVMILEGLIAAGLFFGAWTQIAALAGFFMTLGVLVTRKAEGPLAPLTRSAYVLLAAVCASLLFSGAGAFAFDLPL